MRPTGFAIAVALHLAGFGSLAVLRSPVEPEPGYRVTVRVAVPLPVPPPEPVAMRRAVARREALAEAVPVPRATRGRVSVRTPAAPQAQTLVAVACVAVAPPVRRAPPDAPDPAPAGPAVGRPAAGPGMADGEASPLSSCAPPAYPRRARDEEREGTVWLRVAVGTDGTVHQIEVETSSGHADLDAAAREAARRWRFRPRIRDGRPVSAEVRLPIRFTLAGRG